MTDHDDEPDEHRAQREDREAQERHLAERERGAVTPRPPLRLAARLGAAAARRARAFLDWLA